MRQAIIIVTIIGLCMFALFYFFPLVGICLSIASLGIMLLIMRNAKEIKEKTDDTSKKDLV